MRKIALALAAIAAAVMSWSVPAKAATLIIDGNGKLTGATGVAVGQLYNVEFVEGTCAGLFGGCNDSGDFTFTSSLLAFAAAEALLNQVFFDSALGQFDSNYALTFG